MIIAAGRAGLREQHDPPGGVLALLCEVPVLQAQRPHLQRVPSPAGGRERSRVERLINRLDFFSPTLSIVLKHPAATSSTTV